MHRLKRKGFRCCRKDRTEFFQHSNNFEMIHLKRCKVFNDQWQTKTICICSYFDSFSFSRILSLSIRIFWIDSDFSSTMSSLVVAVDFSLMQNLFMSQFFSSVFFYFFYFSLSSGCLWYIYSILIYNVASIRILKCGRIWDVYPIQLMARPIRHLNGRIGIHGLYSSI